MRGFSKAIITGNLVRDPELRQTPNGASVCSFTVAVNRSFRDAAGNQKDEVSFIDCSAWGKLAEIINQYGKKGSGVLVSGRLDQRSWEDKNTGQKRSRVEITVEDFNFVGTGDRADGAATKYNAEGGEISSDANITADVVPEDVPEEPIDLSEIPF